MLLKQLKILMDPRKGRIAIGVKEFVLIGNKQFNDM